MKWFVTGDCHRDFSRFDNFCKNAQDDVAVLILGDAGINCGKPTRDYYLKKALQQKYPQILFYLVRGNHEERPQNVPDMEEIYDDIVSGPIYIESKFPNIKYLQDGHVYLINGLKTLVIGGAYSIDREYRVSLGLPWFASEQLTATEMDSIKTVMAGKYFDLVLSHTCPIEWEPTDLFLPYVSQNKVDKSMENFLQEINDSIDFGVWLFGHYHADRLERPGVEMLFQQIVPLDEIWNRWDSYWLTGELTEWWLPKSPHFYMEM